MTFRLSLAITTLIFLGCKADTDYKQNYNNSSALAFDLIKQCVDTILTIDSTINTPNYVLDLSGIDSLNKQGIDRFLTMKNSILPTTSDDSTIIFKDGNPENFYMKQSMLIKFKTITFQNDKNAIITVSKIKSTEQIINAIIELERTFNGYRIKELTLTH